MKRIENECLDCKSLGLPCLESRCPYRNSTRFYCDRCGDECKLYHYDSEEICVTCLLKEFEVVEGTE